MKKIALILLLSGFFFANAFAQNAPRIQRAYAYYSMNMPGMIMQDDNGNPVDPVITIDRSMYVECQGTKMPDIRTITYDNILYKTSITKVMERTIQVGKKADSGTEIVLAAKKGNSFWKLDLQLTKDTDKAPKVVKHIVIQGRNNKRPYSFYLYNETRLMVPERY